MAKEFDIKSLLKKVVVVGLLSASHHVFANWSVSGGYANYDEIGFGVAYGTAGYQYTFDNFSVMPDIRSGLGLREADENLRGVINPANKLEVDNFISASLRGQYNVTDSFGVFLQPSYSRIELTASRNDESVSNDDWEFNVGVGAEFAFTQQLSVEATYESIINDDVISVGLRY